MSRSVFLPLLVMLGTACSGAPTPTPTKPLVAEKPAPVEPSGPTVRMVSAGGTHTCAITTAGELMCWGAFASDGMVETGAARPVRIGPDSDWTFVDTADALTCALKKAGSLWCFASHDGGLAVQGKALSGVPRQVGTATDWESLVVGGYQACGLRAGQMHCVGQREIVNAEKFGHEVGDDVVKPMTGFPEATSMSHGFLSTCATLQNGELWCRERRPGAKPARIGGHSDWVQVQVRGSSGCAVRRDGSVHCWLPKEPLKSRRPQELQPTGVVTTDSSKLTVGNNYACAPTDVGWQCWGAFAAGQRGDVTSDEPAAVVDATEWTTLSAGGRHTCGIREEHVACWGDNAFGQLGNGVDGGPRGVPTALDTKIRFKSISTYAFQACAIAEDGRLFCWGENGVGELGLRTGRSADRPQLVFGDQTWIDVAVSMSRKVAVRDDGTLWSFGFGKTEQLDQATDWRAVEVAGNAVCASKQNGSLWCSKGVDPVPAVQLRASDVAGFSIGYSSVCAELDDGTTQCFQVRPASKPPQPYALSPTRWKTFEVAMSDACGIRRDGLLGCYEPFEGKAPTRWSTQPRVELLGEDTWTSLSLGDQHACAIQTDASLWCWGFDRAGALGLDDVQKAKKPTRVGSKKWAYVTVGDESTCGITTDGVAHCWGRHHIVGDGNWLDLEPQNLVPTE